MEKDVFGFKGNSGGDESGIRCSGCFRPAMVCRQRRKSKIMRSRVFAIRNNPLPFLFSCFIWVSISLLIGQAFIVPDAGAQCVSCAREQSFDNLFQKLEQAESIRVIVWLDVDGIKDLTAASNGFSVVAPGRSFPQSGKDADRRLKAAIDGVADGVVNALKGTAFRVSSRFSTLPLIAMEVSADALATLETLPRVVNCVPDRPVKLIQPIEGRVPAGKSGKTVSGRGAADLSKPFLNNTTGIIGAEDAWAMGYTGSGWYVAVLDTGIRSSHAFFAGKTIVEKCYSANNDCPDGTDEDEGSGAAAHYASSYQGYDHGTHVTGIAVGNNGTLFGVAKDADIIAVQVFSRFPATRPECGGSPCVMSYDSDSLKGLEYVYGLRSTYSIASVNMSLGGGAYSDFCDDEDADRKTAIDNLRAVGIATVIATGNEYLCGQVSSPACVSTCISVGASNDSDVQASFSNWHPVMQRFFAPGVSINSSTGVSDTSYASWGGTSMATPHVAGAWAILRQADPAASVTDIYDDLTATGTLITTTCAGGGSVPRINIDRAISCDPNALAVDAFLPQASAVLMPGSQVTLNARVSGDCGGLVDGVTVSATFSNGDGAVQMYDDGLHDDGAADDGLYGNWWIPVNEQDPTTITYTASKTGYTSGSDQVDVTVVMDYCPAGAGDSSYEHIANVTFAGIDNDSTYSGGYADYTAGTPANVTAGTDVNLSVTISPDSGDYLSVFIDWNRNLIFDDPAERYDLAAATDQSGPFTTLVSVPEDAALGDTRMRVVLKWGERPDPCGGFNYGEVEDYTVNIACSPIILVVDALSPTAGAFIVPGVATLLQAGLADQCGDPVSGATVEATFSNGDSPVQLYDDGLHDDGAADDALFADWWTPVNEQDPTTITFTASKTGYTSGTDLVDVAVVSDYCDAGGLDSIMEYITNVTFAGIDNDSTQAGGYADYTAGTPGNVTAGTDVNLSVTINPDADDNVSVFIDWNRNLVFDDPDERYDLVSATDQPGPFSTLVSVPADAVLGDTCLRVVLTRDTTPVPCGTFDYGEVEDYTVNVACNSSLLSVDIISPLPFATVTLGNQVTIQAQVSDQCGVFVDDITVETTFSNGDNPVLLYDDGLHGDGAADDGLYGNWWIPVNEQDPTTITCTASKTGFVSATDQVDVYFIVVATRFLPLIGGWNLISLPLSPLDKAIETVLSSIAGKYISVWSFSSGAWKFYDPASPGFNDLFEMDAGIGYWVNMSETATLTLLGTVPQNSIAILNGWNLVGYNSFSVQDPATALASIAGHYVLVWAYVNNAWLMYDPANPGLNNLPTMESGLGYWINASGDCTWTM